ncbi:MULTISPECIES: hypothetical protein [Bacteroidota]|uniref:hypothetical protein n=1 Tax=Bacteroidota TaxID=976 RepID=UPI002897BF45|nr:MULTISPECIES: hypothetical protein [Bacteroidota]
MKLEEIIKALRRNTINDLLGDDLSNTDYGKIILYAEYTVSTDTDYRFYKSRMGMGELLKDGDMWYDRLCSLKELGFLTDYFLSQYDRKTDDVLVIDIIDHLYNQNF